MFKVSISIAIQHLYKLQVNKETSPPILYVDLLQYSENKMKEDAKGYTRSEWFDHPDTQPDIHVGKPRVRNQMPSNE